MFLITLDRSSILEKVRMHFTRKILYLKPITDYASAGENFPKKYYFLPLDKNTVRIRGKKCQFSGKFYISTN